jgi:hypothetical protein
VRCRDGTSGSFVAKDRREVSAHFRAVAVKLTVVCGIDCLTCQNELFLTNLLAVKENDEHARDLFFVFY